MTITPESNTSSILVGGPKQKLRSMISTGITRGNSHPLRCDDSFFVHEDETHILMAVFDGCSSSKYACLASQLMTGMMQDIVDSYNWYKIKGILTALSNHMDGFIYLGWGSTGNSADYRSTLIITLINKEEKTVETINIGDGLIFIDDQCVLNSDTNVTDYMVDNNVVYNDNHCNYQKYSFTKSVMISTDGLNSFRGRGPVDNEEMYVLFNKTNKFYKTENFVQRTCRVLERTRQIINDDDIAIVRYESSN